MRALSWLNYGTVLGVGLGVGAPGEVSAASVDVSQEVAGASGSGAPGTALAATTQGPTGTPPAEVTQGPTGTAPGETDPAPTETAPGETDPAPTETAPEETDPTPTETAPGETDPAPTGAAPGETDPAPTETAPEETAQAATGTPSTGAEATGGAVAAAATVDIFFNASLLPALSINRFKGKGAPVRNRMSLGLLWSDAEALHGFGLALGANVVRADSRGALVAMVGNVSAGIHRGAQMSTAFNYARDLRGTQVGFVNVAKEARGAQVGLVNLGGTVKGVQIGLFNYAKEADVSIGLLAITKEGGFRPEIWTSDTALINVGFRLPAKYTYSFASMGFHPIAHAEPPRGREGFGWTPQTRGRGEGWEFGIGFGGHVPLGHGGLFIDLDVGAYAIASGFRGRGWSGMSRARLLLGWQIARRVAVFGGPTLSVQYDDPRRPVARPGYGWVVGGYRDEVVRVRVWPGFAAGMRF